MNNYLDWYKDLLLRLHNNPSCKNFLSSGVPDSIEFLKESTRHHFDDLFHTGLWIPNPWGYIPLLDQLASRYGMKTDHFIRTNGASNALFLVCSVLLGRGSHVVVETPCYQPLWQVPNRLGAMVTHLPRHFPEYRIDYQRLESEVTSRTQLVIISNLHNPSSRRLSSEELITILAIIHEKSPGCRLLVDEVYMDFLPEAVPPAASLDPSIISINSLTKVYGLNVLECGWVAADRILISRIKKFQVLAEGIGSRLLEALTSALFEELGSLRHVYRDQIDANRSVLRSAMAPLIDEGLILGDIPKFGSVYFARIPSMLNTWNLCTTLADHHQVYIVPGTFFGDPSGVRIGFGGKPVRFDSDIKILANAFKREIPDLIDQNVTNHGTE